LPAGDEGKINALEKLLRQYGKECVRTGRIALPRDTTKLNGQAG
jgi:acetolactate synthase small subunit